MICGFGFDLGRNGRVDFNINVYLVFFRVVIG